MYFGEIINVAWLYNSPAHYFAFSNNGCIEIVRTHFTIYCILRELLWTSTHVGTSGPAVPPVVETSRPAYDVTSRAVKWSESQSTYW